MPEDANTLTESLTQTLVGLEFGSVSRLFAKNGVGTPTVLWSPSQFDFSLAVVRSFAATMAKCSDQSGSIAAKSFEKLDLDQFEPWLMILKPTNHGDDFEYLRYGSEIKALHGTDMTGRRTSEIGGYVSEFFIALYAAVLIRKESVYSVHEPPAAAFANYWRRLIFPILDSDGQVGLIVAINVADNELHRGLEALPDPSLVVSPDGRLMFANSQARQIFGVPGLPKPFAADYCGLDIPLPSSNEALAEKVDFQSSRTVAVMNKVIVHFDIRVSATIFKGAQYFVVQLRSV